jgi:hypothetical protein
LFGPVAFGGRGAIELRLFPSRFAQGNRLVVFLERMEISFPGDV